MAAISSITAIEAVRGKPLGPEAQEWGFQIGFSLVIMLMLVGTWNDLMRLVARWRLGFDTWQKFRLQ